MNKKQFNLSAIENELKGASLFFPTEEKAETLKAPDTNPKRVEATRPVAEMYKKANPTARTISPSKKPYAHAESTKPLEEENRDSQSASERASYHASSPASELARMVEAIRRVVKNPGAKTTFVRLSPDEKNRLVDLVYTYKRQGLKTSENELVRIAIGCLLEDYNARGQNSMLARTLEALNA